MPWTRTSRGWWRLQLDRCDAPILERIGEVPGVSATARLLVGKVAHGRGMEAARANVARREAVALGVAVRA